MLLLDVVTNINTGFGSLMTSIGIVIVAGTMIGVILERSGAYDYFMVNICITYELS